MKSSTEYIDELTGVYNRRYLKEKQDKEIQSYITQKKPFSIAIIDIDHFKDINDSHGHLTGDVVIKKFADFLKNSLRKSDTLIRYGGDEFVCIMPGMRKHDAEQMHRRIARTLKEHTFNEIRLTISIGIASYPEDGDDLWFLLNNADQAMYDAKRSGRDQVSSISDKKAQIPIKTFVNRLQERETFQKTLVESEHGVRAVIIYGIVGAGKTRLGKEVLSKIKGKEIIWSDCIFFSDTISYFPIRSLIKYHVKRRGSDILKSLSYVYKAEISKLVPEVAEHTSDQLNTSGSVLDRYRLYEGIRQIMEFGDRDKVIVIDNIQWIDKESIEVLKYLMRALRDVSILFVFIHRSEEKTEILDDFLIYMSREANVKEIQVKPFARPEIKEAIKAIIGDEPEQQLTEYIMRESGGIPFYIEEIMRALLDARFLRIEENRWRFTAPEHEILPKNLADIAIKKYRSLSSEAQRILEIASVIGWFDVNIMKTITGYNEGHVLGLIHDIHRTGLIRSSRDHYEFSEAISRNAIYARTVKGAKAIEIHDRVGECLEHKYEGKEIEIAGELALHYYRANHTDKCLKYCIIAGDRARATYANRAAIKLYTWALEVLTDGGNEERAQRIDCLRKRADVLRFVGDTKRALTDLDLGLHLAMEIDDVKRQADLRYDIATVHQILNAYPLLYREAEQALTLYARLDARRERAIVLRTIGTALYHQGKYDESLKKLDESIRISEGINDSENVAKVKHCLANYYTHNGDYNKALQLYQDAASMFQKVGNRFYEAKSLANIGNIHHRLGDRDKAIKIYEDTLVIFQEIGNRTDEAISLMNIGSMYGYQGDYHLALDNYKKCLTIHRDIGSKDWESMLLVGCGMVYHDLGDFDESKEYYEHALSIAEEIQTDSLISYAKHAMGDLNITLQRYDKAEENLIDAYNKAAGKRDVVMDIVTSFAELYLQKRNLQEFNSKLKELQEIFDDTKTPALGARIKLFLGRYNTIAGDFSRAEENMNAALETYLSLKEPMTIAQTYYYLGFLYQQKKEMKKALEVCQKALEYFQVVGAKGWCDKATRMLQNSEEVI